MIQFIRSGVICGRGYRPGVQVSVDRRSNHGADVDGGGGESPDPAGEQVLLDVIGDVVALTN